MEIGHRTRGRAPKTSDSFLCTIVNEEGRSGIDKVSVGPNSGAPLSPNRLLPQFLNRIIWMALNSLQAPLCYPCCRSVKHELAQIPRRTPYISILAPVVRPNYHLWTMNHCFVSLRRHSTFRESGKIFLVTLL